MIDLHTHSTASDGSFSPANLAAHAADAGIRVFALTDHDTLAGNSEAAAEASRLGIGFLAGIELDVEWEPGECHLLGLGLDIGTPAGLVDLEALAIALRSDREERNRGIADRMRADGLDVEYAGVQALSPNGVVGRPHFARYLADRGIVRNRQQAFDRYLAKDRPYYVPRKGVSLDAAVAAIRAAGGLPILAHPLSLYVSWGHIPSILTDFRDRGVVGIEAWHPAVRVVDGKRLEALAGELGLLVTAGSDFHGEARPDRKIGRTAGRLAIDDRYLPEPLAARVAFSAS